MEYSKSMKVKRNDLKFDVKMISAIVSAGTRIMQYGNKLEYSERLDVKIGDESYDGLKITELNTYVSAYSVVDVFTVFLFPEVEIWEHKKLDADIIYVHAISGEFTISCKGCVKTIVDRCLLDMVGFLTNTNEGEFDDMPRDSSEPIPVSVTNSVITVEPSKDEVKRQDKDLISLKKLYKILAAVGVVSAIIGAIIGVLIDRALN